MPNAYLKILTAALMLAPSVFAYDNAQVASTLSNLYQQSDQAFDHKDLDYWSKIYNPAQFRYVDHKGKQQDFAQVRDEWRNQMPLLRSLHSQSVIRDVQSSGDAVMVRLYQTRSMELDGKAIKRAGIWIPLTISETVEDTWRKQGNGWAIVSSRVLQHEQQIDHQWLARQSQAMGQGSAEMRQSQRDFMHSLDCMQGIGYGCSGR